MSSFVSRGKYSPPRTSAYPSKVPEASRRCSGPCGRNLDRKSTRLNSSHDQISYAVFCLKKKKIHVHVRSDRINTRLNSKHDQMSEDAVGLVQNTVVKHEKPDVVDGYYRKVVNVDTVPI